VGNCPGLLDSGGLRAWVGGPITHDWSTPQGVSYREPRMAGDSRGSARLGASGVASAAVPAHTRALAAAMTAGDREMGEPESRWLRAEVVLDELGEHFLLDLVAARRLDRWRA
jgi:hypothetical protein